MSGRSKKQQVRKVKPDETIMEEPHETVVDAPAFPEDLDTHGEIVHEIGHQEMGVPVESLEEHHGVVEEPAETDTSTTKKKSKRRKPAYQFFVADQRKLISIENPDLSFGQTTAKLSTIWRGMTNEERQPYEDRAAEDRRGEESDEVVQGEPEVLDEVGPKKRGRKRKERKWTKDPTAPKKAVTPYILFGKAVREEVTRYLRESTTSVKPTEIMREISQRWGKLTAEEKQPFEEEAAKDKIRYDAEKKAWQQSRPEDKIHKKPKLKEDTETEKQALMIRARGEELFDRIVLNLPITMKQLQKKFQTKRDDPRAISEVILLPNIRLRDSEDLATLTNESLIEVVFQDDMA